MIADWVCLVVIVAIDVPCNGVSVFIVRFAVMVRSPLRAVGISSAIFRTAWVLAVMRIAFRVAQFLTRFRVFV